MALTKEALATLTAAVDRIVPADEWPSASEAGVVDFVLRLMTGKGAEAEYKHHLESLEATSQAEHGKAFSALDPHEQDAVLEQHFAFLEILAPQVIEGYYSDPGNGGNRDQIAWQMIGFRLTS